MSSPPFSEHFLVSSGDGPPLRIGLILDGPTLTAVNASIVRDLLRSGFAAIELVLLAPPGAGEPRSRLARFRAEGGVAFAVYAMLDRRRAGVVHDPLDLEDARGLLAGLPTVSAAGSHAADLPADVIERVRAAGLDVLVHLGSRPLRGAVLSAAGCGVWAVHPGDAVRYRGGPAAYWEIVDGSTVCTVVLRRLASDRGEELILDQAVFACDLGSLARTRRTALFGSTHLLIRSLRLLHERGWDWLAARRPAEPPAPPRRPIDRKPSTADVLRWLGPLAARKLGRRVVRAIRSTDDVLHWRIAVRVGGDGLSLDRLPEMAGFRWVESAPGHYYADPFVVERDGRRWLFFEDFSYARGAATIARAELGPGGELGEVRETLATAGHLSYPMIVFDGADAVMVPESAAAGVVRAYRAAAFPDGWEAVADLAPSPAVDTTIWRQDGRWWFFATIPEPRGGAGMLMLFHADAIDGDWISHPLNPISQDARTSRGAGSLFRDGSRLVRPSQDGTKGYGYSITLNEITTLGTTDYVERSGPAITPEWEPGLLGMHTYNRVGDVEVIDGKVARSRGSVA